MDEEEILRLTQQTYGNNTSSDENMQGEWWNEGLTDPDVIPWVNTPSDESWMDYNYSQPASSGIDLSKIWQGIKGLGSGAMDFLGKNPGKVGIMGALAALGALSKAKPSGGGTTKRYVGPAQQLTRTVAQGKYGPIAQYAAQGGIMHAYASGGQVKPFPMQDGGFVMTEKAMEGADKVAGGIKNLLPEAQPIRGPGDGTSDSIPAYIQGRNGLTPARVSNGESYIPPGRNTREMYALMKYLEGMGRRA